MRFRRLSLFVAAVSLGVAPACKDAIEVPVLAAETFGATLSGAGEVPPVTTVATGTAAFTVTLDTFLSFRLAVSLMDSTTLAHIHEGAAGVPGGVIVTLFTGPSSCTTSQAASPRCRLDFTGQVAQGQFKPSQLTELPVGFGATPRERLDSLLVLMRTGGVYVNVHNRSDPNGHVRGQIQAQ